MLKFTGNYCSAFGTTPFPIATEHNPPAPSNYAFTLERAEEIVAAHGGKVVECHSSFYANEVERYHVAVEGGTNEFVGID